MATAYIHTAQFKKIRIPVKKSISSFRLSLIKEKKIFHFDKKIVDLLVNFKLK